MISIASKQVGKLNVREDPQKANGNIHLKREYFLFRILNNMS